MTILLIISLLINVIFYVIFGIALASDFASEGKTTGWYSPTVVVLFWFPLGVLGWISNLIFKEEKDNA